MHIATLVGCCCIDFVVAAYTVAIPDLFSFGNTVRLGMRTASQRAFSLSYKVVQIDNYCKRNAIGCASNLLEMTVKQKC